MYQDPYDFIKQQVDFDAWYGRNRLKESLYIWQYLPAQEDLPDWQLQRIESLEPPAARDLPPAKTALSPLVASRTGWRRAIHSTWVPTSAAEALLNLDIYECSSRQEAHELLLRLLGEFQLPLAAVEQQDEFGDVAFAAPNGEAVLFARANLVFLLRNAERTRVPVYAAAARFDEVLIRKPEDATSAEGGVRIQRIEAKTDEAQVGQQVDLELETADGPEEHIWYKIFAPSGEIRMDKEKLVYQPEAAGEQEVSAYSIRRVN